MPKYFLVLAEDIDSGGEFVEILTRPEIRDIPSRGLKKKKVVPIAPPHSSLGSQMFLETMLAFAEVASHGEYLCVEDMLDQMMNIARKM